MADLTPSRDSLLLADFATIFAHMWYRDFPLQPMFRDKAQRADWTTHIGFAVWSTANLMGLFTHFESGKRTDAVLKDNQGKAVAAFEWEWNALHRGDKVVTEFNKLKDRCADQEFQGIRFACFICYARSGTLREDYTKRWDSVLVDYTNRWTGNLPPLLLTVVHFEWKGREEGRQFTELTIDEIKGGSRRRLRVQPAYPWDVIGSRWAQGPGGNVQLADIME